MWAAVVRARTPAFLLPAAAGGGGGGGGAAEDRGRPHAKEEAGYHRGDGAPRNETDRSYAVQTTEKDPNDNSLVVRLDLGSRRVLLMGDAGAGARDDPSQAPKPGSIEAQLLAERPAELRADVLVVGHHGSKTGSRRVFVDAVHPGLSVISSGPKKSGSVTLPDAEVVSLLEEPGPGFRPDRDDAACAKNPEKTENNADGRPRGCENVRIAVVEEAPKAEYWPLVD